MNNSIAASVARSDKTLRAQARSAKVPTSPIGGVMHPEIFSKTQLCGFEKASVGVLHGRFRGEKRRG